jgi:hypothetical protein
MSNKPNVEIWSALCRPPVTALRRIEAGRLKGKTDINPQWRMLALTETFGPVGFGWKYEIAKLWTEPGMDGQMFAFALVDLRIRVDDQWSESIPGIGGSMLLNKEKDYIHHNDEAFKMAVTDALSVAMKSLGVAADIYQGMWDGSKYMRGSFSEDPPKKNESSKRVSEDTWERLTVDEQTWLTDIKESTLREFSQKGPAAAMALLEEQNLSSDHKVALWFHFDSKTRDALEPHKRKKPVKEAA